MQQCFAMAVNIDVLNPTNVGLSEVNSNAGWTIQQIFSLSIRTGLASLLKRITRIRAPSPIIRPASVIRRTPGSCLIVNVSFTEYERIAVSPISLYEYDAVARLRDSQLGEARVHDIRNYIVKGRPPEVLRLTDTRKLIPPLHGALLKNEQDVHLFERLAFLGRREGH